MKPALDFIAEVRDGIGWARLNRPASLNAWTDSMRVGLLQFLYRCETDPGVRCIVLCGSGKHFMAGGDVKSFVARLGAGEQERKAGFEASVYDLQPMLSLIERIEKPILASVQGACAGLGFSLVMACDLAIASEDAGFTFAYTKLGTTPDGGASYYLPRIVGIKKAMEIALLSEKLSAREAERLGIVNWVCLADQLEAKTLEIATRLSKGALQAMGRTKRLLRGALNSDLEPQLRREAEAFGLSAASSELIEGVDAFVSKRAARFSDL